MQQASPTLQCLSLLLQASCHHLAKATPLPLNSRLATGCILSATPQEEKGSVKPHLGSLDLALVLDDSECVGHDLARVVVVGEAVYHGRAGVLCKFQDVLMRKQSCHDHIVVPTNQPARLSPYTSRRCQLFGKPQGKQRAGKGCTKTPQVSY